MTQAAFQRAMDLHELFLTPDDMAEITRICRTRNAMLVEHREAGDVFLIRFRGVRLFPILVHNDEMDIDILVSFARGRKYVRTHSMTAAKRLSHRSREEFDDDDE